MKSFRRQPATVNAGSMADIAFLLLIFFLVTTTIATDKGILRQLPSKCPTEQACIADIKENNLLRIQLNANNEIMINEELVALEVITEIVTNFVDNNLDNNCEYCNGKQLSYYSDNPSKAVISLSHDAKTKYHVFIAVQDEIIKAYYNLRTATAKQEFNTAVESLTDNELKTIKDRYPFILSEVMVKR